MRTVNSSKRPINIKKEQNHFAAEDKCAKLSTGLTDPNAGPILPKEDAAAPNADKKSNPKTVNITDDIINITI
jgi:hypothetical protein